MLQVIAVVSVAAAVEVGVEGAVVVIAVAAETVVISNFGSYINV